MGLGINGSRALCWVKKNGEVDLTDTLMLGKQELMLSKKACKRISRDYADILKNKVYVEKFSNNFLKSLGAKNIESLDVSDYQGVDIVYDLNIPITENMRGKYSLIIDGGTTEHIFNYPQAIKNVMDMLRVGGVYFGMIPMNCWSGHGLYQFSPSLFVQIFSQANGFMINHLMMDRKYSDGRLYEFPTQNVGNSRIEINDHIPTLIFVVAKKVSNTPNEIIFQENFYQNLWEENKKEADGIKKWMVRAISGHPRMLGEAAAWILNQKRLMKCKKVII